MAYHATPREFEIPPEGEHIAVNIGWEDKGVQATQWGEKHKAILKYESLTHNMEDGRRFVIYDFLNLAFGENATLTDRRKRILGVSELDNPWDFDPFDLVGIKLRVFIEHQTNEGGKKFAKLVSVRRHEDQDIPDLENEVEVHEI